MALKICFFLLIFCFVSSLKAESFLLPNTTEPESYLLLITTTVPAANRRFTGIVMLTIKALENTNEIFLHSRQQTINSHSLFERIGSQSFLLENVRVERENDDVIKITSEQELNANTYYELIMEYQGNLLLASEGFFRSDYVINDNGNDVYTWQAATHFYPFSARHAFPCYDTTQNNHRAVFDISITHDKSYTAVSNMEVFETWTHENLADTYFLQTPLISPSSLAFFVSGFERIERRTNNGLIHFVYVRASERDYTQKLFEITDKTLDAVESFVKVKPSNGVLHSVVLPGFDFEVGAYYRFNYYREDLILFNPLVTASSKEFIITKLITNGILSQYLGNFASLESWSDAWIFKGLSKFLAYEMNRNDDEFASDEMFISEVLHPTLQRQSFSSEIPFSPDDAIDSEVTQKAACTFRMIYHAVESGVFSQTLQQLIEENFFKSVTPDVFYRALQQAAEGLDELEIDLRTLIEGFVMQQRNLIVTIQRHEKNILRIIKKPLVMPYNFITSSMETPSDFKWLRDSFDETITVSSLDNDDWFLFNIDQYGFYRVNYDVDNWIAITNVLKDTPSVFSAKTRAQLIDDSLNLSKEGFLSYEITLDLLMYLSKETSFLPWSAAIKNLLDLNNFMESSDVYRNYQQLLLHLSETYMNFIGFDDLTQEKAVDKLTRIQMIDFVCRMNSEECLEHMFSKLKSHIDDKEKLPVNLELSVFSNGLMASAISGEGSRLVEALWREMQNSDNTEYRLRLINSLGCYGDVKVLFDLLETTLASNGEARYLKGESFEIIQSVYSCTSEGVEATIDFFIEFQNDAVRRSQKDNLIEILVEELPKKIFKQEIFNKFIIMLDAFGVSISIQAREVVEANLAWKNSEAATSIRNWFIKDIQTSTSESVGTEPSDSTRTTIESTSTETSTLIGSRICLSAVLGISCAMLRILL